jgi:hypothetical protein
MAGAPTAEEWTEWIRRLGVELLRESPVPSLRSCCALAAYYPPLAADLFNAAFVAVWTELGDAYQDSLVQVRDFRVPTKTKCVKPCLSGFGSRFCLHYYTASHSSNAAGWLQQSTYLEHIMSRSKTAVISGVYGTRREGATDRCSSFGRIGRTSKSISL